MRNIVPWFMIVTWLFVCNVSAHGATNIQDRLDAAKPGDTVTLPAGEFRGGVTLPPGVSLKGAGVGKTIIDATGTLNGLTIEGGKNAQVSDLSIRSAQGSGLTVKNADSVTVARVRVTACSNGFALRDCKKGRVENCVSDHNNFGIAVNGGADCAVVNCTMADCPETGLNLAASHNAVVFNNCIVGSAICLNIDEPKGLHIDHNLYFGMFLGQMQQQTAKRLLSAWQFLTGLDTHSVHMPITFKDAATGDFTPVSTIAWALDRATTGDWGTTELAGVKAPETDLFGQRRSGRPDVGVAEVVVQPPRAPNGSFTVATDEGIKSAGVFTKDGFLIAYLFHGLPLPKGQYSFWLPERDYVGHPIPAGDYEVRLAESDFHWKYLNHIADSGAEGPMSESASFNPFFVAFAPNNVLVMQEGPSEDHSPVRGYDALTGKLLWHVPSGFLHGQGVAVDKAGIVYVLFVNDNAKGESRLDRLESATGKIIPWPGGKAGHTFPITSPQTTSLTVLNDRLFVSDESAGKLFVLSTADGQVEKSLSVAAPRVIAGDEKTQVLWVASGDSLVAISADGTKVAESKVVPEPVALAAREGVLAVASGKTGKVHFFDAVDPRNLKSIREFGRGDGPYGEIVPDRFWFQRPAGLKLPKENPAMRHEQRIGEGGLALGPNGELAVADQKRVLVFDRTGKNLWNTIGVFGNQIKPSFATQNQRFWETAGDISFRLNEKDGTWKPEALWDHSLVTPKGMKESQCQMMGDFTDGGKDFLVAVSATSGFPYGPPAGQFDLPILVVARLENFKSVPVLAVSVDNGKLVSREDTNGDGKINSDDAGQPLFDAAGQPMPLYVFARFNYLTPDGSVMTMRGTPFIWKRTGLNARNVPIYEGKNFASLPAKDWQKNISPHDLKASGTDGAIVVGMLSDGGYVAQMYMNTYPGGTGMNNGAGMDLAGYAPDGSRRWFHQLAHHKGIAGMETADDITLTAVYYSAETLTVDADGLGLGGFCEAPESYYGGYWIDHPNLRFFKMPDGHLYATIGNNSSGRHPWFRLENQQSLKKSRQSFHFADDRARELAALEHKPTPVTTRLPQPQVHVHHLKQPLTIDGDLEKWRTAGVPAQIVVGPSGSFKGPGDNSAVIRMAYEGQNLYFQVLQFDDSPVFYQMCYGNCLELSINGAGEGGMQFVVYKNPEGQDIVWRNRFFSKVSQREFDPQHVPRIVKVLPNAEAVTERATLEALYGVDLSKSKVVVTEFKLPIDKETYAQAENDVVPLGPGKSFWIGFFLDDNDHPFTESQRVILWPGTFGMFNPKEDGAIAICD